MGLDDIASVLPAAGQLWTASLEACLLPRCLGPFRWTEDADAPDHFVVEMMQMLQLSPWLVSQKTRFPWQNFGVGVSSGFVTCSDEACLQREVGAAVGVTISGLQPSL